MNEKTRNFGINVIIMSKDKIITEGGTLAEMEHGRNTSKIEKYDELAKDAGNRLRAYILSVSSGAIGILFFSLISKQSTQLTFYGKCSLFIAIIFFGITVLLCLYELGKEARRFFDVARELEKPEKDQNWEQNIRYKVCRDILIRMYYTTLFLALVSVSIYIYSILNIADIILIC